MGGLGDFAADFGEFLGTAQGRMENKHRYRSMMEAAKAAAGAGQNARLPEYVGDLDPTALTEEMVRGDPELRGAQLLALRKLQESALLNGMDPESRAALAAAQQQAGQYEQAQRGAAMQAAQARGMGGSNLSMASQLLAQQQGADRMAMAGTQAAADARRRALQSLQASGEMGGAMSREDFERNSRRAKAMDDISRFNKEMRWNSEKARYDAEMQKARLRQTGNAIYDRAINREADREMNWNTAGGRAAGEWIGLGLDMYGNSIGGGGMGGGGMGGFGIGGK